MVPRACWCCWSVLCRAFRACCQRCLRDRKGRGRGGGRPDDQPANMAEVLRSLQPRASPKSTLDEASLALTVGGLTSAAAGLAPDYEHEAGFFSGELAHLSFLDIEDA